MVDMLERATTACWKSVYPIGGDAASTSHEIETANVGAEEWL